MNKLIGAIVVLLVLALGFAGASYWSGQKAEQWYREAVAEASKHPNLKITTTRYERGVFSSKAVTRYQLMMDKNTELDMPELSVSTRDEIYHGPLPVAGWGVPDVPMGFTGAVVRQTLDPESNSWTRELAKLYGGRDPLVAVAQVGSDGSSNTRITMPPLAANEVGELQSVNFGGLQGQFQIAPRGTGIQGSMNAPTFEAAGKAVPDSQEKPATAGPRINLRNLTMTVNQRKGAFDLMLGDSTFKIAELSVQDPSAGKPVVFSNIGADTTAALSPKNPQQVNIDMLVKTEKVTADPWNGSGSLQMAFHNLDGDTTRKLQEWQQNAAAKADDPQTLDELMKLLKTLLAGKPEVVLDSQAKLDQGDWQGKLTLNFQDYGDIDPLQNPVALMGALEKGLAEMSASKKLVEAILTSAVKEQLRTQAKEQGNLMGEKNIEATAAQQVAQQLQGMVASGFIRLVGDRYQSIARFEKGQLLLNDKPMPLGLGGAGNGLTEPDGGAGIEVPVEPDDLLQEEATPQS
ncbi:MAG: YdgA family protein [Candidatus Competibacter sp.]